MNFLYRYRHNELMESEKVEPEMHKDTDESEIYGGVTISKSKAGSK